METKPESQSGNGPEGGGRLRRWALKGVAVLFAVLWLTLIAASWADAAEVGDVLPGDTLDKSLIDTRGLKDQEIEARSGEASRRPAGSDFQGSAPSPDDEYNFSWLDPEKKIYVLQNRRYLKSHHPMLSAMVGPGFSNAYRTAYNFDLRFAYYLSEAWGLEGFYTLTTNHPNSTFDALEEAARNTRPVVRDINSQFGLLLHWVPWYAKINVFNRILYFDWYFSGGVGSIRSTLHSVDKTTGARSETGQDLTSVFFGTGHEYYLTSSIIVRLDLTGAFYRAPVFGLTGDKATYSNYNFGFGLGLRL